MMTPAEIARFKRNLQRQRAAVAAALPAQLVQGALVLRQVRLDRLRHELIHSNEPHLTLADLAMRWALHTRAVSAPNIAAALAKRLARPCNECVAVSTKLTASPVLSPLQNTLGGQIAGLTTQARARMHRRTNLMQITPGRRATARILVSCKRTHEKELIR